MIHWAFAWKILPALLRGLVVTIEATLLGMTLALVLGLVWALLQRGNARVIGGTVRFGVEFIRSTPLLVQIYFLFYVLPGFGVTFSPLVTGVFALGLHYSAYTSEIYRAGIEGVPRGQWEAAIALGLSRRQTFRWVVIPQAIPPIVPALGNRFIAMFKDTPLLSAITVLEVLQTAKIIGARTFRYFEPLTIAGLLFLIVSLVAAWGVQRVERRLALRT